ncbi:hypothetical protein GCM10023191_034870 [Actinoallomurus oryzae]|uniref:WXG100 family type VII secretion target n=1 Tax=Actinoallomurus oryzae TaxID=502180 RepID=A0ABP8PYS8_9ACTN
MAPNSYDDSYTRPSTWPWGDSKDGEIEFHPGPVQTVINALKADRARHDKGAGNIGDLQGRGDISDPNTVGGGLDNKTGYPAGRILLGYFQNAQANIAPKGGSGYYANFLQSYDAVIKTLSDSLANYNEAEDASLISVSTGDGTTGQTMNLGSGVTPTDASFYVANDVPVHPTKKWDGDLKDFRDLAKSVDPKAVLEASKAWLGTQSKLMDSWEVLYDQGYALADAWKGKAGNAMQQSLKNLYFSSCALADATGQVGNAVEVHAGDLDNLVKQAHAIKQVGRDTWQHWLDDADLGGAGDSWYGFADRTTDYDKHYNSASKRARDYMNASGHYANNGLARSTMQNVIPELPTTVKFTLPYPSAGSTDSPYGDGPAGLDGQGLDGSALDSGLQYPDVGDPVDGSGTDLSGVNGDSPPGWTGDGTGGGTGTDLAGTGNPLDGLGGTHTGFPGSGTPYGAGSSPAGVSPFAMRSGRSDGLPTAAEATALRDAAARGPSAMPFPAGTGGKDSEKKERERTIWVYEEDKIWGADDDDAAPPLIG